MCSAIFSAEDSISHVYDKAQESSWFLVQKTQSVQHLKALYEYNKFFAQEAQDKSSALNEPRMKVLVQKTLSGFKAEPQRLTAEELSYISSSPQRKKIFEGILYYQAMVEIPLRLVQQYGQYLNTRGGGIDFMNAPTAKLRVQHLLQSFYNGPLKYVLLVPANVDLPGGLSPAGKIFKRLWNNAAYEPTVAEWQTLKEYKSEKIFIERKDFMNEHRQWVRIRRLGDYALNAILAVSLFEAFNWYQQMDREGGTVNASDFLNDSHYALGRDEVRIYNETVPFPHMAIEIDGLVYSYGQTHMTVKTAREYILAEEIRDEVLAGQNTKDRNFLERAIEVSGLNKAERVMQVARIHLNVEEKGRLKRYLEMQTGKRYRNHTLAMDCASMVVKALKENTEARIPAIIDPSPSQVIFYLANLKTLGVQNKDGMPLVEEMLQVRVAKTPEKKQHLWRSLYINLIETRIYWSYIHYSAAQRAYLELRYGKEQLSYWDDETLNFFKLQEQEIREQFQQELHEGQLGVFTESLQEPRTAAQTESLRLAMKAYFDLEEKSTVEKLESNDTRFEDIMRNTLRLTLLKEAKAKMLNELK